MLSLVSLFLFSHHLSGGISFLYWLGFVCFFLLFLCNFLPPCLFLECIFSCCIILVLLCAFANSGLTILFHVSHF